MNRQVIITGITGQDGSYLAESLLNAGYEVHGIVRRSSGTNLQRISHLLDDLHLYDGDITDLNSLLTIFDEVHPGEIYNLAAQSHVGISYKVPQYTYQSTGIGAINVMEAAWRVAPKARIYQASSSEMFGITSESPQNELTPFNPISPYAIAKTMAHYAARMYRQQGLFVSCGICFNHESVRRGDNFLTMKVMRAAAEGRKIVLGNLSAIRDWGYAPEFIEGFQRILRADEPDDYVVGTGEGHSVEDFVRHAYETYGLDWTDYVTISEEYKRPIECGPLLANCFKIDWKLHWMPSVRFHNLIAFLADDLEKERKLAL